MEKSAKIHSAARLAVLITLSVLYIARTWAGCRGWKLDTFSNACDPEDILLGGIGIYCLNKISTSKANCNVISVTL